MDLTEERFRALARSAPWRWHALRFTAGWREAGSGALEHTVRAFLSRPGGQRVETMGGEVLEQSTEHIAEPPTVPLDADGLAPAMPDRWFGYDTEAPMYGNYHWVAMLDPVELDSGIDQSSGIRPPGTEILDVTEVEHHGRRAWQARLRPTRFYDPRCGCCPLLYSAESEAAERHEPPPGTVFADHHLVRLDVTTSVCVYSEEVGGSNAGRGHDVAIEAEGGDGAQ